MTHDVSFFTVKSILCVLEASSFPITLVLAEYWMNRIDSGTVCDVTNRACSPAS